MYNCHKCGEFPALFKRDGVSLCAECDIDADIEQHQAKELKCIRCGYSGKKEPMLATSEGLMCERCFHNRDVFGR